MHRFTISCPRHIMQTCKLTCIHLLDLFNNRVCGSITKERKKERKRVKGKNNIQEYVF